MTRAIIPLSIARGDLSQEAIRGATPKHRSPFVRSAARVPRASHSSRRRSPQTPIPSEHDDAPMSRSRIHERPATWWRLAPSTSASALVRLPTEAAGPPTRSGRRRSGSLGYASARPDRNPTPQRVRGEDRNANAGPDGVQPTGERPQAVASRSGVGRIAVVEHEVIAVRVREDSHMADAGVEGVA
jgi:hypothetical protein